MGPAWPSSSTLQGPPHRGPEPCGPQQVPHLRGLVASLEDLRKGGRGYMFGRGDGKLQQEGAGA